MKALLVGCVLMTGCASNLVIEEKPINQTTKQFHAHLKDEGYSFWQRNSNLPFSDIPLFFETLSSQ